METEINKKFSGATWFKVAQNSEAYVAGVGSTGSWLALALGRMLPHLYLIDMDRVEMGNLGGQLYTRSHAESSKYKVVAITEVLKFFAPETVCTISKHEIENSTLTWIMPFTFSCVDSMKSRRWLAEKWYFLYDTEPNALLIDCRLGFDYYQIYCVKPENYHQYMATICDDALIPDSPCTVKSNTYIAMMAAAHMTGLFANHLSNIAENGEVCVVPFFKEVNLSFNMELNEPTYRSL